MHTQCSRFAFTLLAGLTLAPMVFAQETLPRPDPAFNGKIGRTAKESIPDFPKEVHAPKGAPNILLIMTDDVGFGASSTFGGPIPTPALDRLAHNGLRYNQFHTTALCSPTRAALITGRNHHTAATGIDHGDGNRFSGVQHVDAEERGHDRRGAEAERLQHGMVRQEPQRPRLAFERRPGRSICGRPDWVSNTSTASSAATPTSGIRRSSRTRRPSSPDTRRQPDTSSTSDLADKAIALDPHAACGGARPAVLRLLRARHRARAASRAEGMDRQIQGPFDQGWDKVREETLARQKAMGVDPRRARSSRRGPKEIPAWDSLSADQKRLYARMMEVYAAALAHADYHIGRVLDSIAESGELDNTLVIFIQGDNGASAEGTLQGTTNEVGTAANGVTEDLPYLLSMIDELGGPKTYNHYPVGWAHAMDTPFQWTKQVASHFGGTRNGLVISWPERIKAGGEHPLAVPPRHRHRADDPRGRRTRAARRVERREAKADRRREHGLHVRRREGREARHTTQYFELARQSRHVPRRLDRQHDAAAPAVDTFGGTVDPDDFKWELYHVADDFSQADDLAASNPEKLARAAGPVRRGGRKRQRLSARLPASRSGGTPQSGRA